MAKDKEIGYIIEDKNNTFFVSDSHYHHFNIIESCGRPFKDELEMNEVLIENWNKVVPTDGLVFHLGDFAWGGYNKWKEIRDRLNGNIILIKGNHDWKNLTPTAEKELFDLTTQQMLIKIGERSVYLNHFPFLCYGGTYREPEKQVWALHGHVHLGQLSNGGRDLPRMKYLMPTQYDVGVDMNDFRPISWQEVEDKINYQVKHNVNCTCWLS